jgi:hypothetical protein
MQIRSTFAALVLAFLLAASNWAVADEVLVSGDPPLLKDTFDRHRMFNEWLLNVRLTPEQLQEYERHFVKSWNSQNKSTKQQWLKGLASDRAWWERVKKLTPSNQDRERRAVLEKYLQTLAKATASDPDQRMLLAVYETRHGKLVKEPEVTRGKVLVPGEPPLTQNIVDQNQALFEWLLKIKFSDSGCESYKERFVRDWKTLSNADRNVELGNARIWEQNAKLNAMKRRQWHKEVLPKMLDNLSAGNGERAGWLMESYREAWKDALEARPVAVMDGKPQPIAVLGLADPKSERIFDRPSVFSRIRMYGDYYFSTDLSPIGLVMLTEHDNHWWFLPNGRAYLQTKQYYGPISPRGKDAVLGAWARYTIETDFRVRIEFDTGEKAVAYLVDGRKSLLWGATFYSGVEAKQGKWHQNIVNPVRSNQYCEVTP